MENALSVEELISGLRSRGGHLPTKLSEAERKKKEKEKKMLEQNGNKKNALAL